MKRFGFIVCGFVASLTGVMFITPPKFSPNISPVPVPTPSPVPSTCVTTTPTPVPTTRTRKHSEDRETTTALPAVLPTPQVSCSTTSTTPKNTSANGTFVGDAVNVSYGNVQVQITVVNGKITDAVALQSPSGGRSGSISSTAIPTLRQETLSAQSASIQGVSGASYTSNGWINSLTSALTKAGL